MRAPATLYPAQDGVLHFDERTTLPDRPLIGCLAVAPAEGRCTRCSRAATAATSTAGDSAPAPPSILPVAHDGAGLYFGDCKALMGDGEIVAPPEVGALVTASAEPRERPPSLEWPRIETRDELTTLVSGTPLEWSARQAFRELLNWVDRRLRPGAAESCAPARDGRACGYRPDQQHGLHGVLHDAARGAAAIRARLNSR